MESQDAYIPPDLHFSPQSTQSPKVGGVLNNTEYRYSDATNEALNERASLVNIQFTELPILNVYDMTKRSANFLKYKRGNVARPDDLESNI